MVIRQHRQKLNISLHPAVYKTLKAYAQQTSSPMSKCLDMIIREWARNGKIEPLKCTPIPPKSSNLALRLYSIDSRLSWIETMLSDGDIVIYDSE